MDDAEKLLTENKNLVYFVLRRYFPSLRGDQDLAQEGFIGLWKASLKYDGRVKFSTFAITCIRNEMLQYLRKQRRAPNAVSLDAPLAHVEGDFSLGDTLEDTEASAFETKIFADDFMQRLKPQDRRLVELRIAGLGQQVVGEACGISQVTVSRRLKKIQALYREGDTRKEG